MLLFAGYRPQLSRSQLLIQGTFHDGEGRRRIGLPRPDISIRDWRCLDVGVVKPAGDDKREMASVGTMPHGMWDGALEPPWRELFNRITF